MSPEQFKAWYGDWCERRTPVLKWFKEMGPERHARVIENWARALVDTDFDAAMEVNRRLTSGDIEMPEFFAHDATPAFVRKHATRIEWNLKLSPSKEEHAGRVYCQFCDDSGTVSVFNVVCNARGYIVLRHAGKLTRYDLPIPIPTEKLSRMSVPCSCRRGQARVYHDEKPKDFFGWHASMTYDAKKFCIARVIDDEAVARLQAWREDREASQRIAVFDEYNETQAEVF